MLERGFDGASTDEMAAATLWESQIYVRFPDKRALFTVVVTQFTGDVSTVGSVGERLTDVGSGQSDRVGRVRLAIVGAHRFPELASSVSRLARDLSTKATARILREIAHSDEFGTQPAFAPQRLPTTARSFLDLVVLPNLMRVLFEQKLDALRPEIGSHVASSVAFFLAACRSGALV